MIDFNQDGFFLIAGPCVVESKELIFQVGKSLKEWTEELEIPFVFKSSYKKANRSRIDSFTGRSEEHTSELQSRGHLVCRLLLEKKNNTDGLNSHRIEESEDTTEEKRCESA